MPVPTALILYADDVPTSVAFYRDLLEREPVEASPGFALFPLDGGQHMGLWQRDGVTPTATPVGGSELHFGLPDRDAVLATHEAWRAKGIRILQAPIALDFGFTFVGLDPDGTRLRVSFLAA